MRFQYLAFSLVCITALVALFFLKQTSMVVFIFIVEAVLIFGVVELLHRCMPQQLREARSDNCIRIDGSFSQRRLGHERRALAKVRMDLLAVLLSVALSGNWLAFFVHYQVIPVSVAYKAAQAFDSDTSTWKQNLRNERVDQAFDEWSASRGQADHKTIEAQQEVLWYAWPIVILVLMGWMLGSAIFIRHTYINILGGYAAGVAARAEHNVNRDIARLQDASVA